MPKIPVIQSELAPSFQRTGGGGVTPVSFDGLTRGAFDVLDTMERREAQQARLAEQARQIAERQAEDEARVSVSNTMSLAHADWAERLQTLQQSAPADAAGFTPATMKEYDTWRDEAEKSVPQRGRNLFRMQSDAFRTQIHGKALAFETQARQAKLVTDWDAGLDDDRRAVWADPSQFIDALARRQATAEGLSLPEPERDKLITKAVDALAYTAAMGLVRNDPAAVLKRLGYGQTAETPEAPGDWVIPADVQAERDQERLRILEAEASDPQYDESTRAAVGREIALLKKTMGSRPSKAPPLKTEKVDIGKDPVFSNLSPEKLDTIANHALSLVRQQEAGARAQQAASVAEGLKLARGVMSAWDNGYPQDPAVVTQARNAVRGTPHELDLLNAEARFGEAQRFRLMSPAQQQTYLDATRSQANTPQAAVLHEKLSNIYTSAEAEIKRDAFSYGARILNLQPVAMDWSSPQSIAETVPARVQQAMNISQQFKRPVSAFTPDEASAVARQLQTMPVQQKEETLGALQQSLGPRMGMLLKDISKESPRLAVAGGLYGQRSPEGRSVSRLILEGDQLLTSKQFNAPDDGKMLDAFTRQVGDALPTIEAKRAAMDAATAIYAKLMTDKGAVNVKEVSSREWREAVGMVTGGVMEHNGRKILRIGYGKSEDETKQALRNITPEQVKAWGGVAGMTDEQAAEYIRTAPLDSVAPGRYRVFAGASILQSPSGDPFQMVFP